MALLLDALFSSVAFGHFIVDIMNGQRAVLLTYLSAPLGLTNTTLGLISTLYVVVGALTQPVFGWLSDRMGSRWLISGGILLMGIFFAFALLTTGPGAIAWLLLASLCSAAFHPAGTMQATMRGRTHFAGRETTSAAYFFVFGQSGHFVGPLLAGPLLSQFGPLGLLVIAIVALPAGVNTALQLRPALSLAGAPAQSGGRSAVLPSRPVGRPRLSIPPRRLFPVAAFALVAAFQAWSQQNMITFVPKYLSDLGQGPAAYGVIAALFMGGSAFGNAIGGNLADRFGKRRVAVTALALASVPLYLVGTVGWSPWLWLLVPLGGALTGSVHSILVVLAQRAIPGGMAMASGLILGFMFSSGALGTFLSGFLADQVGFPPVFHLTGAIALSAALLASTIQNK